MAQQIREVHSIHWSYMRVFIGWDTDSPPMDPKVVGWNPAQTDGFKSARRMGLQINESKTKYMISSRKENTNTLPDHLVIENYKFEHVTNFTYLGSLLNYDENTSLEIKRRISMRSICYYGFLKQIKSKLLTLKSKIIIYETSIRPVFTYALETWVLNKQDIRRLGVFERKILRTLFGPTKENDEWRIKQQ